CTCDQRYLHSFPTRRSSDLTSMKVLVMSLCVVHLKPRQSSLLRCSGNAGDPGSDSEEVAYIRSIESTSCRLCSTPLKPAASYARSEEHTSELQSRENLVCRL